MKWDCVVTLLRRPVFGRRIILRFAGRLSGQRPTFCQYGRQPRSFRLLPCTNTVSVAGSCPGPRARYGYKKLSLKHSVSSLSGSSPVFFLAGLWRVGLPPAGGGNPCLQSGLLGRRDGERKAERCAAVGVRVGLQASVVCFNDRPANCQSHVQAVRLGCEELIEHLPKV